MIISHNTFTYLRPPRRWMRLLQPIARCQSRPLQEQIKRGGVDTADIRVRIHHRMWWVCHGPVIYTPLANALLLCRQCGIKGVRILIEGNDFSIPDLDRLVRQNFHGMQVYEMRTKKDWAPLDPSVPSIPDLRQHVGSMQSWYGKLCPRLWHALHPDQFARHALTPGNHAFDFI